jgi:hypothetical protein
MLRVLVGALLLTNLLFWSWTRGWLDGPTGVPAGGHREPERLGRQVQPEVMRIVPATAGAAGAADPARPPDAAPAPAAAADCLEAGPLSAEAAVQAQAVLVAAMPDLPAGRLASVPRELPGRWILYMGRFADDEAVARKEEELARVRNLGFERLPPTSELAPGLSLGEHPSRAAASRALERLEERGIRTARVVTLQAPRVEHRLRLQPAGDGWPQRLAAIDDPATAGLRFRPCEPLPVADASSSP